MEVATSGFVTCCFSHVSGILFNWIDLRTEIKFHLYLSTRICQIRTKPILRRYLWNERFGVPFLSDIGRFWMMPVILITLFEGTAVATSSAEYRTDANREPPSAL
jgi:hypothetical protein